MAPPSSPAGARRSPPRRAGSRNVGNKVNIPPLPLSRDPAALLDSLLDSRSNRRSGHHAGGEAAAAAAVADFDPIEFLNRHYETEQSLSSQLPSLRESVHSRMQVLNDKISNALQRQSETADSTQRHVIDAKASVQALEHRILQVREKARMSEQAVVEITADMKRLDCAKRHLQRTITTLKKMHMLVHAMEQLRLTLQDEPPDYRTASHLVQAIAQLLQHFDAYTAKVQPMQVLAGKVTEYQDKLLKSLVLGVRVVAFGHRKAMRLEGKASLTNDEDDEEEDETEVDGEGLRPVVLSISHLQGGVTLVEALGETTRKKFVHEFCQDLLGDYLHHFEPPDRNEAKPEKRVSSFKVPEAKPEPEKIFGLDHIEKRYTWFLQGPLNLIKEKFPSVFPEHWNVQAYLSSMFLQLTRDHILALLDGPRKDPDANNATILLKALQKTIVFEKDITGWLERECGTVFEGSGEETTELAVKPLMGVASVAYEQYMDPYIRLEEQSMDEQLIEALEDRTVDTRGERPVFISSTNLFVYIKGSITRCTALSKGNAFFLLYNAFKDSLKKYAQILNGKLPPPVQGAAVGGIVIAPFGGGGKQDNAASATYRIPSGEEVTVCHVISTCEYCADTMEALEDLIRDTIDEEYQGRVDMISDQEQFHDITAKSIRVLVSGLANRLEGALKSMTATKWEMLQAVGEESEYVLAIHEEVQPFVKTVRNLLPTSYFRSFCDKFAVAFTSTYYENLIRLKRISEPGTQQLLLDLYNLKTLFLKLPVLEDAAAPGKKGVATGASIAPAMYTKTVQKQFGRMETILKLVGTPNYLLIDNFKVQWQGGTSADLQVVMNLKGMKRSEQVPFFEKFGFDPVTALKGATAGVTSAALVSERVQQLQDQGSNVAAQVNSDLKQMRQKVDDFRRTFR